MLKLEFPIKDRKKKKREKEMKRKKRKGKEGFPIKDRKKVKAVNGKPKRRAKECVRNLPRFLTIESINGVGFLDIWKHRLVLPFA